MGLRRRLWQTLRARMATELDPLTLGIALVLPFGWLVFLTRSRALRSVTKGSIVL